MITIPTTKKEKLPKIRLQKTIRYQLIQDFNCIQGWCFDKGELYKRYIKGYCPEDLYIVLNKIMETDFDKISDFELIMICGGWDIIYNRLNEKRYNFRSDQLTAFWCLNDTIQKMKDKYKR